MAEGGENCSIGTITILEGSYIVSRYRSTFYRDSEDDILSGDIVTTVGRSVIHLNEENLKFFHEQFDGEIFVLLEDAKVCFSVKNEKIHIGVINGIVTAHVENSKVVAKNVASPVIINLAENDILNEEFPGLDYHVVIELDITALKASDKNTHFFSVGFIEKYVITEIPENSDNNDPFFSEALENKVKTGLFVEIYDGEVEVKNERDSVIAGKYEKVIVEGFDKISNPTCIERIIASLESKGTAEGFFSANEIDVDRIITTRHIPLVEKEFFIIDSALPGLTLDVNGGKNSYYTVSFTIVEKNRAKSFELSTSTSLSATDTFVITPNEIILRNMGLRKTYDLGISIEIINTGEIKEFTVDDVKTSGEGMSYEIIDWETLDEEKSVMVSRGDKKIKVSTGTTSEEIDEEFKKVKVNEETNPWLWMSILSLIIPAVGICHQRAIFTQNKKTNEVIEESGRRIRQFSVSPEGTILDIDNTTLKILGYDKDELIDKPLRTIYAPEFLQKMEQLFVKWKNTGELRNEEMIIVTKGGHRCRVILNASTLSKKDT